MYQQAVGRVELAPIWLLPLPSLDASHSRNVTLSFPKIKVLQVGLSVLLLPPHFSRAHALFRTLYAGAHVGLLQQMLFSPCHKSVSLFVCVFGSSSLFSSEDVRLWCSSAMDMIQAPLHIGPVDPPALWLRYHSRPHLHLYALTPPRLRGDHKISISRCGCTEVIIPRRSFLDMEKQPSALSQTSK